MFTSSIFPNRADCSDGLLGFTNDLPRASRLLDKFSLHGCTHRIERYRQLAAGELEGLVDPQFGQRHTARSRAERMIFPIPPAAPEGFTAAFASIPASVPCCDSSAP